MAIIHQPHDKFFKQSLKERAIALDFFKSYLPTDIYKKLDLNTLHNIDKSYITPELSEIHSDMVFACQIEGKPGYVPILFLVEQQSTPDKQMAFRLLEYTVCLMRDHLKAGHQTLPLVLPLCIYHGDSPYPHSTDIYALFDVPEIAKAWVFKPFNLIDLVNLSSETLQQHGTLALMELLLKYRQKKEFLSKLQQLAEDGLLRQVVLQTSSSYLIDILRYSLDQGDLDQTQSAHDMIQLFSNALPEKREVIMSFADQLREEGMNKGLQAGIQSGILKGKLENAKEMLVEGMSIDLIKKITRLSDTDLALLEKEDE